MGRDSGEERGVDVDRASRGDSENGRRQEAAIGGDDEDIGAQGAEFLERLGFAEGERRVHLESVGERPALHRSDGELPATAGGAVGLGVDGDEFVLARGEPLKGREGELGRAHEDDARHRRRVYPGANGSLRG